MITSLAVRVVSPHTHLLSEPKPQLIIRRAVQGETNPLPTTLSVRDSLSLSLSRLDERIFHRRTF